ncbi:MAG: glutamate mutase L [Clostridia bacterium]|nr:glutamate mutase L [Clostridia bacterium]
MHADVLIAEIGSTTTLMNAFLLGDEPRYLGQGMAPTTVLEGDVRVGLSRALEDLESRLGDKVTYDQMLATSSAAGGLRMSVHGLVYDMTVRAAEAAALGAGGVIRQVTGGKMSKYDLMDLKALHPNLILIAGGTDYGERETALYNSEQVATLGMRDVPVLYAGNVQNQNIVKSIFEAAGIPVFLTENVYPRLDELNIEPCRKMIQKVFEQHIVRAPGMEGIRDMVTGPILPTPGAVMEAARLLYDDIGDLVVLDIGGATTDVHSVSEGSPEIAALATRPEPFNKRTVEGDLGLFINARHLVDAIGPEELSRELDIDTEAVMAAYAPIPATKEQMKLTERLCLEAGQTAIRRHAGHYRYIYLPEGRKTMTEGKDLSQVKYIVGTGGALTRLPHRESLLRQMADMNGSGTMLYPKPGEAQLLFDNDYIMASLGVLSKEYPQEALSLMKRSMGL